LTSALVLAEIPTNLLYAVIPLLLGVLAVVICVILLLPRREEEPTGDWEIGTGSALKRGQYLQHLTRLLRAIRAINNIIITERDRDQLLERACRTLTETRGYKMAWVGVVEEEGKRVRPVSQAGFEEGYLEAIQVTWDDSPTGRGPTGQAIKTGEPAVMRDIETEPAYKPWREEALKRGYRSSAALPLRFEGRVLAALNVYSEMPDAFDIQEVGLLQEVADHIAYALGSIELENDLQAARRELRECQPGREAYHHAPTALLRADRDGYLLDTNRRAEQLLGADAGEQAGTPLQELPPFRSEEGRSAVERVYEEGAETEFHWANEQAEGRLLCRGRPIVDEDGEVTGSVWSLDAPAGAEG
jgi:GAF domain-containing protein